jgi:hypothetical protein
LKHETYI